jgi:hypothetical protein
VTEIDEDGEIVVMVSAIVSPITKHYCSDFSLYENRETGQWSRKIELEGVDEYQLRDIGKLADLIAHLRGCWRAFHPSTGTVSCLALTTTTMLGAI